MMKARWQVLNEFPEFEKEQAAQNIKLLNIWCLSDTMYIANTAIRKVEDLEGLKIAAPGDQGPLIRAMNAVHVSIPSVEAYDAISKGTVDGRAEAMETAFRGKHNEVIKYVNQWHMGPIAGSGGLAVNLDTWANLPPDVQNVITGLTDEAHEYLAHTTYQKDQEYVKLFTEQGIEFVELPPAEVEKLKNLPAMKTITYDQFIGPVEEKGLPGQKVADRFIELMPEMEAKWDWTK
jgi:TRAP-type C4-dicarboxylate transport system substrate-binding protein